MEFLREIGLGVGLRPGASGFVSGVRIVQGGALRWTLNAPPRISCMRRIIWLAPPAVPVGFLRPGELRAGRRKLLGRRPRPLVPERHHAGKCPSRAVSALASKCIGIDLGLGDIVATSAGEKVEHERFYAGLRESLRLRSALTKRRVCRPSTQRSQIAGRTSCTN